MLQMWEDNILTEYDMSDKVCEHCDVKGKIAASTFGGLILLGFICQNCDREVSFKSVGVPQKTVGITSIDGL